MTKTENQKIKYLINHEKDNHGKEKSTESEWEMQVKQSKIISISRFFIFWCRRKLNVTQKRLNLTLAESLIVEWNLASLESRIYIMQTSAENRDVNLINQTIHFTTFSSSSSAWIVVIPAESLNDVASAWNLFWAHVSRLHSRTSSSNFSSI